MHILMTLFTAALFFALTPHILVSIPAHGTKYMVAATHALLFALIYHLTHKAFYVMVYGEGFETPFNPMYMASGPCSGEGGRTAVGCNNGSQ
jgi:hypothetical protein